MILETIANSYSGIIGLLTFLLGLLLGNWLALGRDRRKEFNEIADEIAMILIKEKKDALKKRLSNGPTDNQFEILKRRSGFFKRRLLNNSIKTYLNVTSAPDNRSDDEYGDQYYKEPQNIIDAISNLLKYVHRK